MFTKLAKDKDAAHIRRIKKATPKQEFKTLSKADQYIAIGRALADLLNLNPQEKGKKHEWAGLHVAINKLKAGQIETDPATGLLAQSSIMKIKRAVANPVKRIVGPGPVLSPSN